MEPQPKGTIVFVTVGIPHYGFDVFSIPLGEEGSSGSSEIRHTDGISSNFNAQFTTTTTSSSSIVFVSDRSGSNKLYTATVPGTVDPLPSITASLFHDRPTIRHDNLLFFASAHQELHQTPSPFHSWSAVYSTDLQTALTTRLTPPGFADLSPAVSPSGDLVAVASYGSSPWCGDFHDLRTSVVAFRATDPQTSRSVLASPGGWPCWSSNSTVLFHCVANDGWWSVFVVDLVSNDLAPSGEPRRVTPPGVHAVTPAASLDGRRIAVATRRKGRATRQIEIFDLESNCFHSVTEHANPDLHHYNPFLSPDSSRLGYHRFRGIRAKPGEDRIVPHLRRVASPVPTLQLLRLNGTFPSVSPSGDLIAINGDFFGRPGLMVLRSDGSKRWILIKDPAVFFTAWSPTEKGVLFVSVGPIFESIKATVQIARVEFDLDCLGDEVEEEVVVEVEVKILTNVDTGNNAFPSCSPDGKSVVFRSSRSGHKNLYVVDAVRGEGVGGEGIRRLTEGEWIDTMPSWSPRGDLIAFSSNRHRPDSADFFSIYLVRPDSTGLTRVYVAGPEGSNAVDRERVNHVCFSPDGEWLLFTANFGAMTTEPVSMPNHFQPYGDLYVCRLDGSGLRRLTVDGYENGTPAWMAGDEGDCIGRLSLDVKSVGEPLKGEFDEPLWIKCDV